MLATVMLVIEESLPFFKCMHQSQMLEQNFIPKFLRIIPNRETPKHLNLCLPFAYSTSEIIERTIALTGRWPAGAIELLFKKVNGYHA